MLLLKSHSAKFHPRDAFQACVKICRRCAAMVRSLINRLSPHKRDTLLGAESMFK
jgi:hypothetical protein